MFQILVINPGSTSTKVALFSDDTILWQETLVHSGCQLQAFDLVFDQYMFRKQEIDKLLVERRVDVSGLSAVVGRGGMLRPLESGVYGVNDKMIFDLKSPKCVGHACNLGAVLAREIAVRSAGCLALIVDPVVVDELQDVARISGRPEFERISQFHALNQKAVARKYAADLGRNYEDLHLVVAHLGGGISVAAHRCGQVVDVNQGLDGYGPFSPERSGTLDAGKLVDLCFSGKYTSSQLKKMLVGQGGLMAHLGTSDVLKVTEMISAGDDRARLVLQAMAYTVAKEIGSMCAVLKAKVDAILITGGVANSRFVVEYIKEMVSSFAPVEVYAGEGEMEALALGGLRVLMGEQAKEY